MFDARWGYVGPQRPWVADDLMQLPLERWRSLNVLYAYMGEDERRELLVTAEGQQYLEEMLLLRRFPPRAEAEQWQDTPAFYVYYLDDIENPLDVVFGGQITLLGYNLNQVDGTLQIQPFWGGAIQSERDFHVFVHVVSLDTTDIIVQDEGTPAMPSYPTSAWDDPEEVIVGQRRTVHLPDGLPDNQYRVLIGLYDLETGVRLTTTDDTDALLLFTARP